MFARHAALARAKTFVGVKEHPPGSNHGPKINEWQKRTNGVTGYPWCAAFVYCMFQDVGVDLKKQGLALPSWVPGWVKWSADRELQVKRPLKGDAVCFDWSEDGTKDHIGLVDRVLTLRWWGGRFTGLIRTVEANTAVGNDSNGGQVMIRTRWVNRSTVFIRVPGQAKSGL